METGPRQPCLLTDTEAICHRVSAFPFLHMSYNDWANSVGNVFLYGGYEAARAAACAPVWMEVVLHY